MATVLKTNYVDDVFTGNRKYEVIDNGDGTYSLSDVTDYLQVGDYYGAAQINATNEAVNALNDYIAVTLSASQWSGSQAPYEQTAVHASITEDSNPTLVSVLEDGASETEQKAYSKAFGIISSGTATTYDGYVTFKVYKKPSDTIRVGLKGV